MPRGLWDYGNEAIKAMIPIHLQAKRIEAEKEMMAQRLDQARAQHEQDYQQKVSEMMLTAQNAKDKISLDILVKGYESRVEAGDNEGAAAFKSAIEEKMGPLLPDLKNLTANPGKAPTLEGLLAQQLKDRGASEQDIIEIKERFKMAGAPSLVGGLTPYQSRSLDEQRERRKDSEEARKEAADARKEQQKEAANLKREIQEDKKREKYTQDESSKQSLSDSLDNLADSARDLLKSEGLGGITGLYGRVPDYPGSPASVTRAKLETLKGQVGMNALQAMRDASKTGGALGQVSDFENKMLQNSLKPLQSEKLSEAELRKSLQGVIDYTEKAKARVANAFKSHWSGYKPDGETQPKSGKYKSPAEVKSAFQSGQLSQEEAEAILKTDFGME